MTFTPAADPDRTIERHQIGQGSVRFNPASWSDLPTMYHVVNAPAALPIIEPRGGSVTTSQGGKRYLDQ